LRRRDYSSAMLQRALQRLTRHCPTRGRRRWTEACCGGGLRQAKAPQRPGFRKHCCRPGTEGSRTFENNGVAAFAVSEDNTSRECAYYGCEVVRKPMGACYQPPWAHIAQRRERCPEHHAARAGGAGHKGRVARAHHCGELHSNSVEDDTHNPSKRRGNTMARAKAEEVL